MKQTLARTLVEATIALLAAGWLAGCASERLDSHPPAGVNLSGQWKFNPNLSDDADKLGEKDDSQPLAPSPSHRGHGGRGGGGGGSPPIGSPPDGSGYNFLPTALKVPGLEQSTTVPTTSAAPAKSANSRGASISRYLKAPLLMVITQKDASVNIRANLSDGTSSADDFTPGSQTNIPYGHDQTADRTVGWRGSVFVIMLKVKKGGYREDDFAIDDDGRLIMTTFTKGGRVGKIEIKRVYDRVKG